MKGINNKSVLDRQTIYNRWFEFSLNLAETLKTTSVRKQKIIICVKDFITMYNTSGYVHAYADKPIRGWDTSSEGWECIGDHAHQYFEEYEITDKHGDYTGKFLNQILSCIRAGLDVAVPDMPGGGVLGFTMGDIREAYHNNIPQWLNEALELNGDESDNEVVWL